MNHLLKVIVIVALSSTSYALGSEAVSVSTTNTTTAFGKMGPYTVTMSEVSDHHAVVYL